jgi:cysteine desulfurase
VIRLHFADLIRNRTEFMAANRAYFDHNATTPLRSAAAEAVLCAMQEYGNPSSVHAEGRKARAMIDFARKALARAVSGEAKHVIFTSGATEALNTLLRPSPLVISHSGAKYTDRLLVLATEHSAASSGGGFALDRTDIIPVDRNGIIDLSWLDRRLQTLSNADGFAPVTIAVQLANSETGVIQPVSDASTLAHRYGALMVCDCVAAFGKIPVNLADLKADAIVISAHKFGGPKGTGAIIFHGETLRMQQALLTGGGQEMRRRSGTENVPGIAGMGVAATEAMAAMPGESLRLSALRDQLLADFRLVRPDLVVFGEKSPRLPNTLNFAIPGMSAEIALIRFDLAGVAISSGSACSSGKITRSPTLTAMGVPADLAECALRFSLGHTTTQSDIQKATMVFADIAKASEQNKGLAA